MLEYVLEYCNTSTSTAAAFLEWVDRTFTGLKCKISLLNPRGIQQQVRERAVPCSRSLGPALPCGGPGAGEKHTAGPLKSDVCTPIGFVFVVVVVGKITACLALCWNRGEHAFVRVFCECLPCAVSIGVTSGVCTTTTTTAVFKRRRRPPAPAPPAPPPPRRPRRRAGAEGRTAGSCARSG